MAQFSKLVITAKGQALIAKMIQGAGTVQFTKVCTSSQTYSVDALEALTTLGSIKQTSQITKITRTNNVNIQIETAFDNKDLTAGYYVRALGLYAIDPDDGEILYAVTAETSGSCYFPAYNNITVSGLFVKLVTNVGNASSVSLEVNPAVYATIADIQDLQAQISDLQAFVGYVDNDIYGVEVDFINKKFTRLAGAVGKTAGAAFDSVHAFGGRRRCNVTNDGKVVAYHGDTGFVNGGNLAQQIVIENGKDAGTYATGTAVQVMVEQPKFYYKVVPLETEVITEGENHGHHLRKARYYMSDTPKTGFKVHPAFVRDGVVNDYIYLAAFEASLFDVSVNTYITNDQQVADFTADMLASVANSKPISGLTQNLTRANTRALARKRGAGWEQSYAATVSASQMLMLIEYASFNMQTCIGGGAVNKTDDGTTNMSENTGATISLGNASGAVTNINGVQIVSYRGEENFWGNIWTWVDGMNIKNPDTWTSTSGSTGEHGNLYVADHDFTDNIATTPYKDTGIYPCYSAGGYVSAFGYSEEFDWLFIPTALGGNSSVPVGDYFWNYNSGWRVAKLGARWTDGLSAGAFCWDFDASASSRARNVGGRLVYVPSGAAA